MDYHLYPLVPLFFLYLCMEAYPFVAAIVIGVFLILVCSKNNFLKILGIVGLLVTSSLLDSDNSLWIFSGSAWMCLLFISTIRILSSRRLVFWKENFPIGVLLLSPLLYFSFMYFGILKNPFYPPIRIEVYIWKISIIIYGSFRIFKHLFFQKTLGSWLASATVIYMALPLLYGLAIDAHYQKTTLYGHKNGWIDNIFWGIKEKDYFSASSPGIIPLGRIHAGKDQIFYVPPAHPFLKTYAVPLLKETPHNTPYSQRIAPTVVVYPFIGGVLRIRDRSCKEGVLDVPSYCRLQAGTYTINTTHYLQKDGPLWYSSITGYMVERTDTITVEPDPIAPK